MEVVLLVSFPTKSKYRRLRLEVQVLPTPVVGPGIFPRILGIAFFKSKLCLQKPKAHQGVLRSCDLCLLIEDVKIGMRGDHECSGLKQHLLDTASYRLKVPTFLRDRLEVCLKSDAKGVHKSKDLGEDCIFECGKGIYTENLVWGHPQVVSQLIDILKPYTEIKALQRMLLSFDDTTGFLRLELAGNKGVWTVDTLTWDAVQSDDLEDWCFIRLDTVLADPQRIAKRFIDVAKHISEVIHRQVFVLTFLERSLSDESSLLTSKALLRAEFDKFMKWLSVAQKYLAIPLGDVLTKPRYHALVRPGLDPPDSYLQRQRPENEFDLHEELEEIVGHAILHFTDIKQTPGEDDLRRFKSFCGYIEATHVCELVRGLSKWAKFSTEYPNVWKSVLRRLRKLTASTPGSEFRTSELPLSKISLKSLHKEICNLVLSSVTQQVKRLHPLLFLPDQMSCMRPVEGLSGFRVIWMTTSRSGLPILHIKSREAPHKDYLVQVSSNKPKTWLEIPGHSFQHANECGYNCRHIIRRNSVWIIRYSENKTKLAEYLFSRIPLGDLETGSLHTGIRSMRWVRPARGDFFPRYQRVTTDDCFIMITGWERREGIDQRYAVPLQFIKYQADSPELAPAKYLVDATPQDRVRRFCGIAAEEEKWQTTSIVGTSNKNRFLVSKIDLKNLPGPYWLDTPPAPAVVKLAMYRLNLSRGECYCEYFQKWTVNLKADVEDSRSRRLSTFSIGRQEYMLYSIAMFRMLISFDTKTMQMVLIDGQPTHEVPKNLGAPIKTLGSSGRASLSYFARSDHIPLSERHEFQLVELKYRPIRL